MEGSLEAITGPVYSGKTSELSRRVRREQVAGLRVLVLQAAEHADRRLRTAARLPELGVPVLAARSASELRARLAEVGDAAAVIALDNAHEMAADVAAACDALAGAGKRVLAAGLDRDSRGRPYATMAELLARCDSLTRLGAVCPVRLCRERATASQALAPSQAQPPLFEERFEPRCPEHFRPEPLPAGRGRRQRRGRLTVYAGCMFAGKTQELLTHYDRLLGARRRVRLVKPRIDRRYALADVVTHDGVRARSRPVETAANLAALFRQGQRPHAVFIDEAQFLPGLAEVAGGLLDEGIDVVAACLDQNYRGEPWPGIPELLARADAGIKLQAICARCYRPATRTLRLTAERADIAVGGAESYAPACRRCHVRGVG